ncbi:unnamed protein product [Paramecium sonneborni]|uniref:Ubiquitin-like protease family profile domain-containing protein n=1 Tax=Paramecium sonneborni TaxID=65129 RepID=A0A8S1LKI3_9CILI|nr:unnamed protein product [Paramecium sonneborni]
MSVWYYFYAFQGYFVHKKKENFTESQLAISQKQDAQQQEDDRYKKQKLSDNQSLEKNIMEIWIKDCNQFKYDLIQNKNGNYENVLLFKNIQFYYDKINSKQEKLYQVKGFIYLTEYDQNFNPKYKLQSGNFLVDLNKRKFQLNGEGIEYQGKSKFVKYEGNFKDGEYIHEQKKAFTNTNQNQKKNNPRIIIIDEATGEQVNAQNIKRQKQKQVQKVWCKYNQQISINDINILQNLSWMTSNIIDSYVLQLNIESENKYFKLNELEKKQVKRILLLPTSLTTNFGDLFDKQKAYNLLEQELLEYSQMNLDITKIYKKIGFPINKINFHWYFLLFDAENGEVQIFDSTSNTYNSQVHNKNIIQTLAEVLKITIQNIEIHKKSGQQRNGYSCGYFICSFMRFLQEQQFLNNQIEYYYKENEIIPILKNTIARIK